MKFAQRTKKKEWTLTGWVMTTHNIASFLFLLHTSLSLSHSLYLPLSNRKHRTLPLHSSAFKEKTKKHLRETCVLARCDHIEPRPGSFGRSSALLPSACIRWTRENGAPANVPRQRRGEDMAGDAALGALSLVLGLNFRSVSLSSTHFHTHTHTHTHTRHTLS